jgi:predicted aconitase
VKLTEEERDILEGKEGATLQKVMQTVVLYGDAVGAERFVDLEGGGHFAVHVAMPALGPPIEMLDELVEAGLRTKYAFTVDPRPPLDFENLALTEEQEGEFKRTLRNQAVFEERLLALGLRDADSFTCTPYLPQVGNLPHRGTVLAWSESSCVVFANSVLGARTNRTAAVMDLLLNILGKTPLFGLLTSEGRQATWLVEVRTSSLPHPQLLGAAIGAKVVEDVPYIAGLDALLGPGLNERTIDFLKEMGAACAAIGAVGLYHVENITPEAVDRGRAILTQDHKVYAIDDHDLEKMLHSYPVMWPDTRTKPQKCLIGCPHLSLRELHWWTDSIQQSLESKGRRKVAIPTLLCAAPQVLREFEADEVPYSRLTSMAVNLSPCCIEVYMDNQMCSREAVVTNSNKLRAFSTARMFLDEELLEIVATGEIPEEG